MIFNSPRGYLKFKKSAANYIKEKEVSIFMSDKSISLLKENLRESYPKNILEDAYYIIKLKELNNEEITTNTEKEILNKLMEPEKRIQTNDIILQKMFGNDKNKKDTYMKNLYGYLHLSNNLKYQKEKFSILNEKRKMAKKTIKEAVNKWEEDEQKKDQALLKRQKEEAQRLEKEKEKFKKLSRKKK